MDKFLRNRINLFISSWIILVLSVVIYYFAQQESGMNFLLIYSMYAAPLLLITRFRHFTIIELLLACTYLMMFLGLLHHPEHVRYSTFFYTGMFFSTFLLYKSTCESLSVSNYIGLLKFLVFAYFFVLIIQQIQVTFGWTVFNQCWVFEDAPYKLNSLSMEPSNTLLIMPLVMFSYIKASETYRHEKKYKFSHIIHEDFPVWFAFLYVCLTCGSMTVFISLPVFYLYFLSEKPAKAIPIILGCIILSICIILNLDNTLYERFLELTIDLIKPQRDFNLEDRSASVRIIPFYLFIKHLDFDSNLLLGHGIDQFEQLCNGYMGIDFERHVGAKNILCLFYDYGWLAGLSFLFFIVKTVSEKVYSFEFIFYLCIFSIVDINHYILWLFLVLMYTNRMFAEQKGRNLL